MVSAIFDPDRWVEVEGFQFEDITYHRAKDQGTVRIAFNRPEVLNAFRPKTVDELYQALDHARQTPDVGVVLLTGNGPSKKHGKWAFSAGGDQRVRGPSGYQYEEGDDSPAAKARMGRLHILEVQRLIRFMPKVVIAVVSGWAVGGGHSLHVVCDLTIASREHALFKQPVFRREDLADAVGFQLPDLFRHDHAAAAPEDLDVRGAPLAQQVDHVFEKLHVPALVARDGDALHVLLDGRLDDLVDGAVVAQMNDLGTAGLQQAANQVDGGVVSVEKAGRRDEADAVFGFIDARFHGDFPFSQALSAIENKNPAAKVRPGLGISQGSLSSETPIPGRASDTLEVRRPSPLRQ